MKRPQDEVTTTSSRRRNKWILLATDFLRPARRAFPYAVTLAFACDARLLILHVLKAVPRLGNRLLAKDGLESVKTAALLELGRLARLAEERGVGAEPCLLRGSPTASIIEKAQDLQAHLIVMGTYGRTGWDRLQLGSTANAVLQEASCGVLTVHGVLAGDTRPSPLVNLRRLLVATDFSSGAQAAVAFAAGLAKQVGAQILVVHAHSPLDEPADRNAIARQVGDKPVRTTQRLALERVVSSLKAQGIVADSLGVTGLPVPVILGQAERWAADLIVMGTRGRRGLSRLALGSVADTVIRRAGCPVLVAKDLPQRRTRGTTAA